MFEIVEGEGRTVWFQGDGASTFYKGQIVAYNAAQATHNVMGAVSPLLTSTGVYGATLSQNIAGVVVGFNNRTPLYTTVGSRLVEYSGTAGCTTQAHLLARPETTGVEGMHGKADKAPMVQVALIHPHTVIRGPLCNAAYGTPPTELTLTVVVGDGMVTAATTAANDAASIAGMGTIYCRTGKNMGIYRRNKNTTNTAPSVTMAFPFLEAVGDKIVAVPLAQGACSGSIITALPLCFDVSVAPVADGTGMFGIYVLNLDLKTAGREYADFMFMGDHFSRTR